eukprot:CAMPEP_0170606508 /NCGR_PEP_ID=MMETSP0224-20130122/20550_1 /TAXON_ID=285029 /ORGANISM="Togula jolla, Strain CCCM 725" /LENGTH=71 /DNA_ID=CAMNT_0010931595 /DNA_START=370 /DNA_END=585 /DNA_ORIENTATION=+
MAEALSFPNLPVLKNLKASSFVTFPSLLSSISLKNVRSLFFVSSPSFFGAKGPLCVLPPQPIWVKGDEDGH